MDLNQRLSRLSPEQRELFRQKLEEKKIDIYRFPIPIQDRKEKSQFPLSFGQERLWYIHQLDPEMFAYNITGANQLEGNLNRAALKNSIDDIVKRHEILRTAFTFFNQKPVQVISPEVSLLMEFVDLTGISPENQTSRVMEIIREETRCPFELSRAPLLRTRLLRLEAHIHIFLFVIHHIISDALSVQIFIRELLQLYEAFCQNRSSPLPALSAQYVDYACWQRLWFGEDGMGLGLRKAQEAFWLHQFSEEVPVLTLPTDYPRSAILSFEGERLTFQIEFQEISQLKQIALKEKCSFYIIVLTLFYVFLSKLSGMEAIVVGTPVTGRRHAAVRNLIGMFVNMLPLINFPYPDKTFRELLKEVRDGTLTAFENQEYPLGDIIERISINRDPGRNPLFDVVFNLTKINVEPFESTIGDLRFKSHKRYFQTAKFDLTMDVFDDEDRLNFEFEYCTKLFKRNTVERFIGNFKELIRSVLLDMDQRISIIDWIPADEKKRMFSGFNECAAFYPEDQTLIGLFQEQAGKTPDRIALRAPSRDPIQQRTILQWSYRTLDDLGCQMAILLSDKGVHPETLVALKLEPFSEMAAAIIGTLKAGCAYLPIDPHSPAERVSFILSDSKAEILLKVPVNQAQAEEKVKEEIPEVDISTLFSSFFSFTGVSAFTSVPVDPSSMAYVIYTSGTTGRPKGVLIEHRNVVSLLFNDRFQFDFTEKDVWTLFHSYCFDFSVWEMYGAWLYGGELVMVSKMAARDTRQFFEILKENQVSVLSQTPSAFYNLMNLEVHEAYRFLNIRYIIFGGEALHPARLKAWRDRYPDMKLINMYGITETTVHVTFKELENHDLESGISNIGKPIPTLSAYVVDTQLNLLPTGVAGELLVGGEGVGRGYLNRPELTVERFVENPYRKGERLYRSGDLVRFCPGEELEYLGRIDFQVKIRGFRIELQEIETHLVKHPQIEDVVVIDRQDKDKNNYLAAYFVPLPTEGFIAKEFIATLRESLFNYLPEYMIPASFVPMEKIPLTSNGKVDRKALPEPDITLTRDECVAPRNRKERVLTIVWQEVLGIKSVGITDHFFEIGGDSIKAIQVSVRLKKYDLILSISDFFLYPTIKELGKYVRTQERTIDQGIVEGEVELTPIQCWFFHSQIAQKHHFNHSVMLYRKEGFSEEILITVLKKIVEHHDALRIVYRLGEDSVIQVNRGVTGSLFDFDLFDYRESEEFEEKIEHQAGRIQGGINLETGPLVKVGLFKTAAGDHLLIVIHHLVMDRLSWRILLEDFITGYRQLLQSEEIELPDKTDSFKNWAEALKEYADGNRSDDENAVLRELAYWQTIDSKSVDSLPVDFEVGHAQKKSKYNEVTMVDLEPEQTELLLGEVNWAYNTDINDILLTALGLALKEWRGIDTIGINLTRNGRESVLEGLDVSRTMGWFDNQYPVILDIKESADLSYNIKNVKETLKQIPHQGIGYGILKYFEPVENTGDYRFIFEPEVNFKYMEPFADDTGIRESTGEAGRAALFTLSPLGSGHDVSPESENRYKLDINGTLLDKRLLLSVTYNKLEYNKDGIERLAAFYESSLLKIIDHCCGKDETEPTPSDLGYSDISIQDLEDFEDDLSDID